MKRETNLVEIAKNYSTQGRDYSKLEFDDALLELAVALLNGEVKNRQAQEAMRSYFDYEVNSGMVYQILFRAIKWGIEKKKIKLKL